MKEELQDIEGGKKQTIVLNGHEYKIRCKFKFWRKVTPLVGSIEKIMLTLRSDPANTLPIILAYSIADEPLDPEVIALWLDDYGLAELKDLTLQVMEAITEGLPKPEKGGTPTKAE